MEPPGDFLESEPGEALQVVVLDWVDDAVCVQLVQHGL